MKTQLETPSAGHMPNQATTRRAYKRPEIRSSGAYERLALACTGMSNMFPPTDQDCPVGSTKGQPGGSCSSGCIGS